MRLHCASRRSWKLQVGDKAALCVIPCNCIRSGHAAGHPSSAVASGGFISLTSPADTVKSYLGPLIHYWCRAPCVHVQASMLLYVDRACRSMTLSA